MKSVDYYKDISQLRDQLLGDIRETYRQCQENGLAHIGYVAIHLGARINGSQAFGVGVDEDNRVFIVVETITGEDVIEDVNTEYADDCPVGLTVETLVEILDQLEEELKQFGRSNDAPDDEEVA